MRVSGSEAEAECQRSSRLVLGVCHCRMHRTMRSVGHTLAVEESQRTRQVPPATSRFRPASAVVNTRAVNRPVKPGARSVSNVRCWVLHGARSKFCAAIERPDMSCATQVNGSINVATTSVPRSQTGVFCCPACFHVSRAQDLIKKLRPKSAEEEEH